MQVIAVCKSFCCYKQYFMLPVAKALSISCDVVIKKA